MGKNPAHVFGQTIKEVATPEEDPVYGEQGPLMRLWGPGTLAKL